MARFYNIYHNYTRITDKPLTQVELDEIKERGKIIRSAKQRTVTYPLSECRVVNVIKI